MSHIRIGTRSIVLYMSDDKDKTSKGIGLAEITGAATAGGAAGIGGLIAVGQSFEVPELKAAHRALKEAEEKARELYTEAAKGVPSLTSNNAERLKWIEEQVKWAPDVVKHRKVVNQLPHVGGSLGEAFGAMSTTGKITIGAIAVGAGLAAGYLINKWRNRNSGDGMRDTPTEEQSQNHRKLQRELSRDLALQPSR